jgi:hypothetical protein
MTDGHREDETMNSKTLKLAGSVIAILAFAANANARNTVADELRCQADAKMAEARMIGCVAGCRDRAELISSYDELACSNRCEARYENTVAVLGCEVVRRSAATLDGMDGITLDCQADVERLAARALQCSARCAGKRREASCNTECDADYTARLDKLECAN